MSVQQLLPIGLAFIMFTVGLGLKVDDFWRVFSYPKAFSIGLFNQILLLPVIGLILASFYQGPPEFALGIMILAACPGGITSNLLSVLAGGNAALSVSMTAITSLASLVTVPAILSFSHIILFGNSTAVDMPVGRIMGGVFLITCVPIVLGMILNAKAESFSDWIRRYVRMVATGVFVCIVIGAFIGNMDKILNHFWDVGLFLIALNVLTMLVGFATARQFQCDRPESITICLECGLQNAALAIFIAVNVLDQIELMVPAIIYALTMNISAAVVIFFARRTSGREIEQGV